MQRYFWRAVDHGSGGGVESTGTKRRDRNTALKFIGKTIRWHGTRHMFVTGKQDTCRWFNNRTENSHLPLR
nr:transposase [Pseudorhodobacter aquimaris]